MPQPTRPGWRTIQPLPVWNQSESILNAPQPADNFASTRPTNPQIVTEQLPFAPHTIGGTSGDGSGAGANRLNINIGGGNFSYDIGPNTDYFAQSAYSFLGRSFSADSNLLGATIFKSQDFLKNFATPLMDFNTTVLPSMFGTLSAQNFSLGAQAVQAQADVARASVAASRAATAQASAVGGGGGLCFITTAVCETVREADDGVTLSTLRNFRDTFMLATKERRELVLVYYRTAPSIVRLIKARRDARELLERIFTVYIMPARIAIERGENNLALAIYATMLYDVQQVVCRG